MSQIAGAGGQPQKSPKYAPIYTGRVFNGLYTNRSPLRGVLPSMYEQFYKLSYGDVMIAGANVEVSNRLTLVRRPGAPVFAGSAGSTFTDVLAFDEFRVNKAASDAFGTTLEEIFTMVATPGALAASLNGVTQNVFSDPAALGQTYMQAIGNELYFSNGIDNKKWLQSLITWAPNFNPQGTNGLVGTYPFMSTYLLTGATSPTTNTQQIQQLIGIAVANITEVAVAAGVLTLTVNNTGIPNVGTTNFPIGTMFQLWGVNTATWLNGAIITITAAFIEGTSTTIVANYIAPTGFTTYSMTADTGYVQQIGTTPVVAVTGATQPTWATSAISNTDPNWGSTAPIGNVLLDGNILWIDRGPTVENWGIAAPTSAPITSDINSTTVGWKAQTYYSAPGVFIDTNGNIWQVTTTGTTGATDAPFLAQPTPTPYVTTVTSGTAVFTNVGTVVSTGTTWQPHIPYQEGKYSGAYPWPTATPEDGAFLPDWKSGQFLVATASGVPCLFTLQKNIPPSDVNVPISVTFGGGTIGDLGWTCQFFNHSNTSVGGGTFDLDYSAPGAPVLYGTSTPEVPTASATGVSSLLWDYYNQSDIGSGPMKNYTLNSAGECNAATYTTPWAGMPAPGAASGYEFCQYGKIRIPVDGMSVTFNILANTACMFGVEAAAGAVFSGFAASGGTGQITANLQNKGTRTLTAWNGYPLLGGANGPSNEYGTAMAITISFPTAGVYGIEFDFARTGGGEAHNENYFMVTANGSQIVPESATTQPWFESATAAPVWSSAAWNLLSAPQNTYPSVLEVSGNAASWVTSDALFGVANGNQLAWYNLGPVSDMAFAANTPVTVPSVIVIDTNSNEEVPYESGVSGATQPTWQTVKFSLTADQPPLQWINEGSIPPVNAGSGEITATSTQGWKYWIALVNTLDNTVSNASPASLGTGPVINGNVTIPPGSGLNLASIDPQADYVAIFRSTDGGAIPLLINGLGNSFWTIPLTQYLQAGYIDTTPDVDLNELITGAIAGENTPPLPGINNLTYHLSRGFYSIGDTVYFTSGANAPSGNGNGTNPGAYDQLPSRVVRLVPLSIGLLVFTISDIYIIAGNGTASSPILPAVPYAQGIGLANYNALDINGSLIGFFTTDKQFLILDPSAGLNYVGNPIGDQFRLNNGTPGQSWDTNLVTVTWYTNGEDQGWFVGDGKYGWYKLISTPSPEVGQSWSPFATIAGGISAMNSIETSPGVHTLLVGPSGTGYILSRDLNATTDGGTTGANGTPYNAYGIFGSFVFALPGQVAKIAFITTVSVRVGSPVVIGVIFDEALPYYKGSFDILKHSVTDPPNLPESKSFYRQRFYLAEDTDQTAYCSDMQILVQWPAEAAQSELQTFTVFGAYEVEA
jgi:hypothetical protein